MDTSGTGQEHQSYKNIRGSGGKLPESSSETAAKRNAGPMDCFSNVAIPSPATTTNSDSHAEPSSSLAAHGDSLPGNDGDISKYRKVGVSYRALPERIISLRCSNRTPLCKQVLNDNLVSVPTWSKKPTAASSRQTQYEKYIEQCEEERFELDMVIESNEATIKVLTRIENKLLAMSREDLAAFSLDDTLGGTSSVIHIKAVERIYGDNSNIIIEGIKRTPGISVPIVLRRLKAKNIEWRQAQKRLNKVWREGNVKYYEKYLDHQEKFMKSKNRMAYNKDTSGTGQEHQSYKNIRGSGGKLPDSSSETAAERNAGPMGCFSNVAIPSPATTTDSDSHAEPSSSLAAHDDSLPGNDEPIDIEEKYKPLCFGCLASQHTLSFADLAQPSTSLFRGSTFRSWRP